MNNKRNEGNDEEVLEPDLPILDSHYHLLDLPSVRKPSLRVNDDVNFPTFLVRGSAVYVIGASVRVAVNRAISGVAGVRW